MKQHVYAGFNLPLVSKQVTQEVINKYAETSGDFNPLHVDPEFARSTPYKGTIAHGLLSLAYISEMMGSFFGEGWLSGGEMDVKFLAPVRPGDSITVQGIVKEIAEQDNTVVFCDVVCLNQNKVKVVAGTTRAVL